MTRADDGRLLVLVRNGCLKELYERCLHTGFHGRYNGSRKSGMASPTPGSLIVLGSDREVIVIHQDDHGRGKLVVVCYQTEPGLTPLKDEVITLLSAEPDLPFTTVP